MRHRARCSLALLAAVALACGDDGGTRPDGDERLAFSFEGDLEGWRPDSADFCELDPETGTCPSDGAFSPTEVEVVTGTASDGSRSVRLSAQNFTDAVKIWIEQPFEVEPNEVVRVTVSFDLGTSAFGPAAWTIIGAVSPEDPTAAFAAGGDDGIGDFRRLGAAETPTQELTFLEVSFSDTITAGPEGNVWVALGVWGTFEVTGEYFVDDVSVEIEQAG